MPSEKGLKVILQVQLSPAPTSHEVPLSNTRKSFSSIEITKMLYGSFSLETFLQYYLYPEYLQRLRFDRPGNKELFTVLSSMLHKFSRYVDRLSVVQPQTISKSSIFAKAKSKGLQDIKIELNKLLQESPDLIEWFYQKDDALQDLQSIVLNFKNDSLSVSDNESFSSGESLSE